MSTTLYEIDEKNLDDCLVAAERFLHERIPLTRAMGLRVLFDQMSGFAVEAPVALNHNHLQTAFGGSINAVATLAGYAFLWLELRDQAAHVVVRASSIRFIRPVRQTIRAVCCRPDATDLNLFYAQVRAAQKAPLTLAVQVVEHGRVCAEFEGTFVALPETSTARN